MLPNINIELPLRQLRICEGDSNKNIFWKRDEVPLWLMNDGELVWVADSIIFPLSFIIACYFLEIRMRINGEGDCIWCWKIITMCYGSMEGTSFLFCFALISCNKENNKYCFI
jgi:hypothetical protein